jgi:hypothetical protein
MIFLNQRQCKERSFWLLDLREKIRFRWKIPQIRGKKFLFALSQPAGFEIRRRDADFSS